jgi:hypothetical protein
MPDIRIVAQATSVVNVTPLAEASQVADFLTADQFSDLYEHICHSSTFAGFSAVPWEELGMCDVINEPTEEPEGTRIYVRDGWPVAAMEFDVGYRLVPGMITNHWQQN